MSQKKLTILIGKRILSEANDLKRTIEALAKDINIEEAHLKNVIDGKCNIKESYKILNQMASAYSIDISDLYLLVDDCENGIKIMTNKNSIKTSRIVNRTNKDKEKTPYYEYRDCVMSNLAPYKPEWIKQLRIVNDSNPLNKDVIYNNGHFMHQITLFVGPVNFYWEVNGEKFCREMNTGDSNYITPYWPHSFTSRDKNKEAYILAITFGGEVRRAQKELYALGEKSNNYIIDYRNYNRAIRQLIKQHLLNENMTIDHLNMRAKNQFIDFDLNELILRDNEISRDSLKVIASLLNIELDDLLIPKYKSEDEVVVKHSHNKHKYNFPNEENTTYIIETLARTSKMPLLKGFTIEVINKKMVKNFNTSLHTYICNYGKSDVVINWEENGSDYNKILKPQDSAYLQPFIRHGFSCEDKKGLLFLVRIPGSINLSTQRELSYMANVDRVFNETKRWF